MEYHYGGAGGDRSDLRAGKLSDAATYFTESTSGHHILK
jgi:hypothetical protein